MQSEPNFWNEFWRENVIEISLNNSCDLSFVEEIDSKIIGFICSHDCGFRSYLSEFIVDKNYRKQGIGKKLLTTIETELSKRGCKILITDAWHEAEGFYKKLGWSKPDATLLRKNLF